MVDFRYHIVSICALFIMLAVGIVMGQRIAAPAQVKQQTKLLGRLKSQVDGAVQDGQEAKRRLAHVQHAIDVLRGRMITGKLAGKRVAIVQCGDYPDATRAARSAVEDAGASVTTTVVITDSLVLLADVDRAGLIQKMNGSPDAGAQDPAPAPTVADVLRPLATALCTGSNGDAATAILQSQRYITISGDEGACNYFVLVGGRVDDGVPPPDRVEETERAIINDLREYSNNVTVVGCEPLEAKISSIPAYQKSGIATVDCIDQPLGQLDLPFALRGGGDEHADYGLKNTATRETPVSFEEPAPESPKEAPSQ